MRRFSILLSILLFSFVASPIASSAQQSNAYLTTGGNIRYNSEAHRLFSTSFEDLTVFDGHHLSDYGTFKHYFNYGPPNSPFWIDHGGESHGGYSSPQPRTGTHSLGMSRVNIERSEFLIWQYPWNGGRYWYVSVWLYFPPGWYINSTNSDKAESLMTYNDGVGGACPTLSVSLWGGSNPYGPYALGIQYFYLSFSNPQFFPASLGPRDFQPMRGGWSHWELYFDRGTLDNADGSVKIWVDGVLKREASNIVLHHSQNSGQSYMEINPFNLYIGSGNYGSETRWMDDLEVWDGLP